ncbi:MAG: hemolysin XhlA family protein [Yoonia sp.]|uniref:hemolysin XhlA family protein n=1 Tax=Rhodobacterales TaxID=204455 RepID=UPI001FF2E054|nr:hemolysin XhlA family protein [Loktanella sp. F6476L]MCK0119711.1 hemolysin XhlA family protein [Loktanella sp. F6476L]UWQ97771.1 hemolysin XhlA family protein [Rhodobacteraceae bacterium S2214]
MDHDWIAKVDLRLNALETRGAVNEVHRDNVADRLGYIEDTLKWLVRLVIGGLLMSAVAFVLQGGLNL